MRVRIYDKEAGRYFKAEAYASLNNGIFQRCAVIVPSNNGEQLIKLFDFYDRENPDEDGFSPTLINVIIPDTADGWIYVNEETLEKTRTQLGDPDISFTFYSGYDWLLEDSAAISAMLKGESVNIYNIRNFKHIDTKLDGWNYIETQEDVEALFYSTNGFHDSILKTAKYISGGYVCEDKSMNAMNDLRILKLIFDSQWNDSVELAFEGITDFYLRPGYDSYGGDILSAALIVKDETVFFADEYMERENFDQRCTCVKAFSLRWRFV